jgi:hypothetical protein
VALGQRQQPAWLVSERRTSPPEIEAAAPKLTITQAVIDVIVGGQPVTIG